MVVQKITARPDGEVVLQPAEQGRLWFWPSTTAAPPGHPVNQVNFPPREMVNWQQMPPPVRAARVPKRRLMRFEVKPRQALGRPAA